MYSYQECFQQIYSLCLVCNCNVLSHYVGDQSNCEVNGFEITKFFFVEKVLKSHQQEKGKILCFWSKLILSSRRSYTSLQLTCEKFSKSVHFRNVFFLMKTGLSIEETVRVKM